MAFVHKLALCEANEVGDGSNIWAFAQVMRDAKIGSNCNVCGHAFIESGAIIGNGVTIKNGVMIWDGVEIEDGVFVGPGVIFTNDMRPRSPRCDHPSAQRRYQDKSWLLSTKIREGASLGAGCIICPGVTIGRFAMIGAGSVVTKDVDDFSFVFGNPGTIRGYVCRCGEKLPKGREPGDKCEACCEKF